MDRFRPAVGDPRFAEPARESTLIVAIAPGGRVARAQWVIWLQPSSTLRSNGRRSVCYDRAALEARKEHKPKDSAADMAARWGTELLTEEEYRVLQTFGEFDTTTSSWVKTPMKIRQLGGALFCDRRYDTVFVYHNGADSYYAARGFRCMLRL